MSAAAGDEGERDMAATAGWEDLVAATTEETGGGDDAKKMAAARREEERKGSGDKGEAIGGEERRGGVTRTAPGHNERRRSSAVARGDRERGAKGSDDAGRRGFKGWGGGGVREMRPTVAAFTAHPLAGTGGAAADACNNWQHGLGAVWPARAEEALQLAMTAPHHRHSRRWTEPHFNLQNNLLLTKALTLALVGEKLSRAEYKPPYSTSNTQERENK
uniref:Uncharacterized protein n=1 Tax=Oryza brachyantha TaxID=4533 RepID=J3N7P1_ORYBR